jgi:hypothetical protein
MLGTFCFGNELIAPTRILENEVQQPGKLSVFSEPPGLSVTLDGKAVGKTPLNLASVSPGAHVLGMGKEETTVIMGPGEVRRMSFFKGTFIEIPAEEKVTREPSAAVEEKPASVSAPEQPAESKLTDPLFFQFIHGFRLYNRK